MPPLLPPHPRLYEIHTYAWLEELSSKLGKRITLEEVPEGEWDRLRALGMNCVWLMGVWERSPVSRLLFQTDANDFPGYDRALPGWKLEDVVGSPYSVRRYLPDARIGMWDSLDKVRERLHARGMLLFLDFVPNHVAPDHPWIERHPEYFLRGSQEDFRRDPGAFFIARNHAGGFECIAKGRDPYYPPWKDVAQLNLFDPAARAALIGELREIARHADGVRCDMAMLVLNDVFARTWSPLLGARPAPKKEFWTEVREAVGDLILLAEAYWGLEQRLLELGFSFAYDKVFYDALRDRSAARVRAKLEADLAFQQKMSRSLENHDEQRSAAVFGASRLPAAAALVATAPSIRFYHHGQLEGRKIHLPIPLRAAAPEPPDPEIESFYSRLLRITDGEVYQRGAWRLLSSESAGDASAENIIAFDWRLGDKWKLIVANPGAGASQAHLRLGDWIVAGRSYTFSDELNGVRYLRDASELRDPGLYVRLDPGRAHVFDISPV